MIFLTEKIVLNETFRPYTMFMHNIIYCKCWYQQPNLFIYQLPRYIKLKLNALGRSPGHVYNKRYWCYYTWFLHHHEINSVQTSQSYFKVLDLRHILRFWIILEWNFYKLWKSHESIVPWLLVKLRRNRTGVTVDRRIPVKPIL